jgi:hypothetical protein
MRINPRTKTEKNREEYTLTKTQTITRFVALVMAFVSVFFFFFKILFF